MKKQRARVGRQVAHKRIAMNSGGEMEQAVAVKGQSLAPLFLEQTEGEDGIMKAFLAGRSENTLKTYRQGIKDFTEFMCRSCRAQLSGEEAVGLLLRQAPGAANAVSHAYRADMIERGLSPSTVNNRLAALRSLVKLARRLGVVNWSLEVENVRARAYRDTRGPGVNAVQRILDQLTGSHPRTLRDRAIVRLLFDLSLRRAEVVSLDIEDIDIERRSLNVRRKGGAGKEVLSLPGPTAAALEAWLAVRGAQEGPVFINFDRAGKGERLTGTSVYRILVRLGERCGTKATPHGLRHSGITTAATKAQERGYHQQQLTHYSGHKNSSMLDVYIDQVENVQGKIAELVAAEVR